MGTLTEEYKPFGLQVIRVISGENELSALEFMKHYRLRNVCLLDVNRMLESRYNSDGWPFLLLADREGKIVFKANNLIDREMAKIKPLIEEKIGALSMSNDVVVDDVYYIQDTLKRSGEIEKPERCDRFPSIACSSDGKIYVVFTSNRNGNSDIFLRVFDGKGWSDDKPVAITKADEFDGRVIVDKNNRVWVSWTSNADGENYNIWVASIVNLNEPIKLEKITQAYDDAMHSRMTYDKNGYIWVTYYKWEKMGSFSRDKEIYVRRWDDEKWSDEIQVSPTDVPNYEDHSDPAIASYNDGVVISWSWDFHQPQGYTKEASSPTIFIRPISSNLKLGQVYAMSGHNIDVTPSIIADKENNVWCAWDSLLLGENLKANRKGLFVRKCHLKDKEDFKVSENLSGTVVNVCTPSFAVNSKGLLTLVWAQNSSGNQWTLMKADFDPEKSSWSKPQVIMEKDNPRFPSIVYDNKDNLWVAYSVETTNGREITIIKL